MLGFGFGSRAKAASIFDPATQSWDALFLAPYASSPWAGTASLGTSGSRSLAEATNPPTAGTPVNGKAPSTYNGTTQKLTDVANISTYITTTEGTATACFLAAGITGGVHGDIQGDHLVVRGELELDAEPAVTPWREGGGGVRRALVLHALGGDHAGPLVVVVCTQPPGDSQTAIGIVEV